MFKILSIDGGGIRGIIPAKTLALAEEELARTGKANHICDYFDFICGTSTGGIQCCMLLNTNRYLQKYVLS